MEYAYSRKVSDIIHVESLKKDFIGSDYSKPFEEWGLFCYCCWEPVIYVKESQNGRGPFLRHYPESKNFTSHIVCQLRSGWKIDSQSSAPPKKQDRKILITKIKKAYFTFNGLCSDSNKSQSNPPLDEELKTKICDFFAQKLGERQTPGIKQKKCQSMGEIKKRINEFFLQKKEIFTKDIEDSLEDTNDKLQGFWRLTNGEAKKVICAASKAVDKDSHVQRVWLTIHFILYSQDLRLDSGQDLLTMIVLHALERMTKKLAEQQLKILLQINHKCRLLILLDLVNVFEKALVVWLCGKILERICLIDWDSVWNKHINMPTNLPINFEDDHFLRLFKGRYVSKSTNPKFSLEKSNISENFSTGFPIKIEHCREKGVVLKLYAKHYGFLENCSSAVVEKCISSLAIKDGLVTFNIDDANLQELYKDLDSAFADGKLYGVENGVEKLYLNDCSRLKGADSPLKGKFKPAGHYFPAYFDYVVLPHTDILEELYKPLLHESNDPVVKLWIIAMMAYKSHQPIQVLYKENEQDWILPDEYSHELLIFPQIIVGNMM